MKCYKRKEYTLFLILLYTALTFCNPCFNHTLNAVPYPNDCQAFILCWLSRAYLQTCPNDLYFDIKTNNCQPLVATTCCNMTLPLLIIPIPIYQGSTGPTNKTKIWPFTYTSVKQTNHSSAIPLSSYLNSKTTFIGSTNRDEATTSIISTWNESTDLNQSSKLTSSVTEISTRFKSANNEIDVTESTIAIDSGQTNVYTTSSISSTTGFHNESFKSSSIVSTDISEATTPIVSTLWTDSSGSSSSGYTLNTAEQTEIETTMQPTNSIYVTELTQFEESKKTESYTNVQRSPTIVSSTKSSNNNPSSTSIVSTNTPRTTIPIIFTLWSEMTDSSLSSGLISNVTERIKLSTIPLEKANTYTYTTEDFKYSQPNAYTTDSYNNYPSMFSTNQTMVGNLSETTRMYNNITELTGEYNQTTSSIASTLDLSSKKTSTTLLIATNAPETTASTLSTELTNMSQKSLSSEDTFTVTEQIEKDTMVSLETSSTDSNEITKSVESSKTNLYSTTLIESSTKYSNDTEVAKPSTTSFPSLATFDSTLNTLRINDLITTYTADITISSKTFPTITSDSLRTESQSYIQNSTINSSIFSTKYSTTEHDESSTTSEYLTNTNINTSIPRLPEYLQNAITMDMPSSSSDFTENNKYITQENLSTRLLLDQSYLTPEVSTINSLTSSTMLSTDTNSIITTDTFPRKYEIFTESSTLLPLFSSATNIMSSTKNQYFPTISSTTGRGEPLTVMQYSKDDTLIKSSSYFTEDTTPERVSIITTSEYKPTTVTSSQFETTNINSISSSMTSSSNVSPTDALRTEPKLFSSTTNNLILFSTTEVEELSTIPQFTENISPDFKNRRENNFSTLEISSKKQLISTTNAPKSETTSILPSSSESTDTTKYITMEPEATFIPFLTTAQSFSPRTFTDTTESIWDPVTFKLPSSPLNFATTADYTTVKSVITDSTSLPINTEMKDGTAMTMDSSILTTDPITYTENSLQTNSETTPKEIKSTLLLTTLLTEKSVTSSTDKTTAKPDVTQTVRTLPPLPYSPPPCVFTTTTQKSTSSEKPSITIPSIVTSTYITPEPIHEPFSEPICGFRDKFVFPDESDCSHYYECLYGGIRKVTCRYGYEFNPYALKCMPHLEANCQERKSFKDVMELLYYISKLNLGSRDPTKYQENDQDNQENGQESETK